MKTYKDFCRQVAEKHGLGSSLVTGHKASYFAEANELMLDHLRQQLEAR